MEQLRNLFADLGLVDIDATADEVTAAYRRVAMELHPDRLMSIPTDDPRGDRLRAANDRMAQVNAAYEALRFDETRMKHRDALRAERAAAEPTRNGLGAVLTESGWAMPKGRP